MGAVVLIAHRRLFVAGLTVLVSLIAAPVHGQWPEDWSPFQPVEGLGLERVRAIGAGQEYLWIGTTDGLYRYDGHAVTQWLDDSVEAILTDQNGVLWLAGGRGLYRLVDEREPAQEVFTDARATCLYEASDGDLWVGTPRGARRLDAATGAQRQEIVLRSEGPDPLVQTIAADREGGLWLGTWLAGAFNYDPLADELKPAALGSDETGAVHVLFLDSQGNFWLGADEGAFRYREGIWMPEPLTAGRVVRVFFEDSAHNLWLGTSQGLIRHADEVSFSSTDGLPGDSIRAIAEDPWEGALWVGTGEGVARLEGRFWRTYTAKEGLPHTFVRGIAPDGRGGLWIGTIKGPLCRFQAGQCVPLQGAEALSVRALWWDDRSGVLWVAAREGLWRYDGQGLEPEPGLSDVLAVARDTTGRLWVSTREGLFVHDGAPRSATPQGAWSEVAQVNGIYADGRGYLWFSTSDGLARCTEEDVPRCDPPYLAGRDVRRVADDGAGNFWVATNEGVYLYLREVDAVSPDAVLNRANGLPSDSVYDVYRDEGGVLWFGTEGGLSRYSPGKGSPRLVFEEGANTVRAYDGIGAPFQLRGADFRANPERLLYSFVLERDGAAVEQGVTDDPSLVLSKLGYRHLWGDRDYRLRALALDWDLRFSDQAVLDIVVKARPLWEEPWFPFGAAFVSVASILTGVGVREARRRRGRFAYRYDVELQAIQAQPDSLTYGIAVSTRRTRLLGRRLRTPTTLHQLQLDPGLGNTLPAPTRTVERLMEGDLLTLGQALYRSLAPPELQRELEALAVAPKYGLRWRLRFERAPGLATLPWELMHGGDVLGLLGQREDTALVRYLPPKAERKNQWVDKELRVLVVLALPQEVEALDLGSEKERIDAILGDLERVAVDCVVGVHAAELLGIDAEARTLSEQWGERLREDEGWDVVHFMGHAGLDRLPEPDQAADVVLWGEDEEGGYLAVDATWLKATLGGLPAETRPKLFVLNACETAHVQSTLVQTILQSGVGAVVGMQWPVRDQAAQSFTEGFYRTLAAHGQVDRAVSVGRNSVAQVMAEGPDWAAPVLVMQTDDGFIFKRA